MKDDIVEIGDDESTLGLNSMIVGASLVEIDEDLTHLRLTFTPERDAGGQTIITIWAVDKKDVRKLGKMISNLCKK